VIKIECKELYRVPITIELIEDILKLGEAWGKKIAAVENIYNNKEISDKLRIKWMVEYNKEWHESISEILVSLREKTNLKDEPHIFTYDLKTKELIVIDILKTDYDKLCREHNFLVSVNFKDKKDL
jgi:hypothetical protein